MGTESAPGGAVTSKARPAPAAAASKQETTVLRIGEPSRFTFSALRPVLWLFAAAQSRRLVSRHLSGIFEAALPRGRLGAETTLARVPSQYPNCGGTFRN